MTNIATRIFDQQIETLINSAPTQAGFIRVKNAQTGEIVKTGATSNIKDRLSRFNYKFKLVRDGMFHKLPHYGTHRYDVYCRLGGYFTFDWDLCEKDQAIAMVDAYEKHKWQIVNVEDAESLKVA